MTGGSSGGSRTPALDGLRGVAVLIVLVGHLGVPGIKPPGTYGVTIFFVLSGYLITTILLNQLAHEGRISFRAFYERRTRRLLPALLATVALAVVIDLVLFGSVPDWPLVLGTLGYVANFVMGAGDWFPLTSLGHTWSLSIEEQFYLVWPLVLIGLVRLRRAHAGLLLAGATVVLLVRSAVLWANGVAVERMYFAADVRAIPLLMGCALAFMSHRRPTRRQTSMVWQFYGAVLILFACTPGIQFATAEMVWLPAVAGLGAVMLIHAGTTGSARWLGWRPLAFVGQRSYGLYLYSAPLLTLLTYQSWLPTASYWLLVLPLLFGVAELSWRYLEQPFLSRRTVVPSRVEQDAFIPELASPRAA